MLYKRQMNQGLGLGLTAYGLGIMDFWYGVWGMGYELWIMDYELGVIAAFVVGHRKIQESIG